MIRFKILRSLTLLFSLLFLLSCSDDHSSSPIPPGKSKTPQQDKNQSSDDSKFGIFPNSVDGDDDDNDNDYDDDDNITDNSKQEQNIQAKSIEEQLQQKQPVNQPSIIQQLNIIPSADITSSSMSTLKKKVFTQLINKEHIDFSDITNLLIEEQVRYYNTDNRDHSTVTVEEIRNILETIARKIYTNISHVDNINFDIYNEWCKNYSFKEEYLKTLYETELDSLSSSKEPLLYNSKANSIPYILKDRRTQDYSSTVLHQLISRYDPCFNIKDNIVIFEKNHVLPGYMVEYMKGKSLHANLIKIVDRFYSDYALSVSFRRSYIAIGAETSTKGSSLIFYKDIENYKDNEIRIVDAELFAILEIFKNDISNINDVTKQVLDLTAKKYGIDPKINYGYNEFENNFSYNGANFSNSDNSPLSLESYSIKKGYTRYRDTIDGTFTKQQLLKKQKEKIKIVKITRDYVLTKDGDVLYDYNQKPVTKYYTQHLSLDNISANKPPLTDVINIVESINQSSVAALKKDGTVVILGDKEFAPNYSDTEYASANGSLTNIKKVVATYKAFAALKEDGTVVSWGSKEYGGDPNYSDEYYNVKKANGSLTNIKQIISNDKSFVALKEDGTVVSWGKIYYNDDTSERPFTELMKQLTNVKKIASSFKAYAALKEDGTVITWGNENAGGRPDKESSYVSKVNGYLDHVVELFSDGYSFFVALKDDGSILTWGDKSSGGDPNYSDYSTSKIKGDLTNIKKIIVNNVAVTVLKKDGTILTWGEKAYGGDPDYSEGGTLAAFEKLENVEDVYGYVGAFVAYKSDGSCVSWGNKKYVRILEARYDLID